METALLFPGQGSQKPGMLHTLVDDPAVHDTLDEISDVLGSDVRLLDSPEALQSTVAVQIALVGAGVATARALQRNGPNCSAVAGMSAGAFSAAVIAEAISLSDAVRLVRSRAQQMEPLYLHDAMTVAQELGCDLFLELPPGHALAFLAKENITGVSAYALTGELQFVLQRVRT